MTPAELARAAHIARQIIDGIERRILTNLIAMHKDEVPADQIAAYLELEREQLDDWIEHRLEGEIAQWVATWPDDAA